jgi:hypothetical protein
VAECLDSFLLSPSIISWSVTPPIYTTTEGTVAHLGVENNHKICKLRSCHSRVRNHCICAQSNWTFYIPTCPPNPPPNVPIADGADQPERGVGFKAAVSVACSDIMMLLVDTQLPSASLCHCESSISQRVILNTASSQHLVSSPGYY